MRIDRALPVAQAYDVHQLVRLFGAQWVFCWEVQPGAQWVDVFGFDHTKIEGLSIDNQSVANVDDYTACIHPSASSTNATWIEYTSVAHLDDGICGGCLIEFSGGFRRIFVFPPIQWRKCQQVVATQRSGAEQLHLVVVACV